MQDACAIDLTTTTLAPDGARTAEAWAADPGAPIDCFYVYPTVSRDTTAESDMVAGDEERDVVRMQFARFASVCRPFAPMYRQVTLRGLRPMLAPGADTVKGFAERVGYRDVVDAWNHYLAHENNGRGVVAAEDGIAMVQAELCHIRPHTSKSAAAKWLRDWPGPLYRSRSCLSNRCCSATLRCAP